MYSPGPDRHWTPEVHVPNNEILFDSVTEKDVKRSEYYYEIVL